VRIRWIGTLATVAVLAAGCGQRQANNNQNGNATPEPGVGLHGHPQAVEPIAGKAATPNSQGSSGPAVVSVGPPVPGLAQPVSDAEIRKELARSGIGKAVGRARLTPDGLAVPPANAPAVVQQMIQAGNQIAHLPYRFGGGHGTFVDTAYDCSGSLSYVFAAGGLLNTTLTSGEFMNWGDPGNGHWVTVFANQGHTFMYIAGLRFDTVARAQTGTRWSNQPATEGSGFVATHPPGL
jgi:cell wall-associated NlpC family hydrolase